MRRFLFYVALSLSTSLAFGQNTNSIIVPDSCSPGFREIYDFNVGDVFQYATESYGFYGGITHETKTKLKYTISERTINGDTFIYVRKGIQRFDFSCDGGWSWECETPSSSRHINDTMYYIDSADHILNKCPGVLDSTYFLNEAGFSIGDAGPFQKYAILSIDVEDTIQVKVLLENLIRDENDSLVETIDSREEEWAKGLGMIKRGDYGFEGSTETILVGYIKNGDTTGTITRDQDLIITGINNRTEESLAIYPNPTTGKVFVKTAEASENIQVEIFDVLGHKIMVRPLNGNTLDLSSLNKGIYFLKFIAHGRVITRKVMLE